MGNSFCCLSRCNLVLLLQRFCEKSSLSKADEQRCGLGPCWRFRFFEGEAEQSGSFLLEIETLNKVEISFPALSRPPPPASVLFVSSLGFPSDVAGTLGLSGPSVFLQDLLD